MNLYFLGTALNLATLFMIAGAGACVSIKCGEINLGGEGQIYLGGFIAAIVLNNPLICKLPGFLGIIIAFLAAFFFTGILGLVSGVLYQKKDANILFTSFIISVAIIPLIDGLIAGPFRSKTGNLLATQFIMEKFRFPSIMRPSPLNITIFLAVLLCIILAFLFYRTATGRKHRIFGISHNFADYIGYDISTIVYNSTFYSAGYHGLCGAVAVCGTYFTCHSGFYAGLGWNTLTAALIAAGNPLILIFSSIGLAIIVTYSNSFGIFYNTGFDISSIIQAIILFVIANVRGKKYDS